MLNDMMVYREWQWKESSLEMGMKAAKECNPVSPNIHVPFSLNAHMCVAL